MVRIFPLLKGLSTYLPGLGTGIRKNRERSDGTASARYCYSVWLRHLTMAHQNRLPANPQVVAELGPGNSLGVGLAALLSGARKYYSLDVVNYAANKGNTKIFEELVELFKKRTQIPGEGEFPEAKPYPSSYEFPSHILTEERLNQALKQSRIELLRNAVSTLGQHNDDDSPISYFIPWHDSEVIKKGSVDLVYSQAVLEHIDNLDICYQALSQWLKPGGYLSFQIDFKCHETATEWNGHWGYSDIVWRTIRGRRPYLLNREPHSTHIRLIQEFGFEVICDLKVEMPSRIERKHLAPRFRSLSDEDLTTSGAYLLAVKKG